MAYAKLAELEPQYGLYSSFMGVLIYWFFATSKDITIGVSCAPNFFFSTEPLLTSAACGCHVDSDG